MKKLRKMLGDPYQPEIQALMRLIETQSKDTIVRWCIRYAADNYLPIYSKLMPHDTRPQNALKAATDWLNKSIKLPEAKKHILACHEAARELEKQPAEQAVARAIGQGASSIHTVTHALGIAFYGAAAVAYNTAGLNQTAEVYDKIAAEEFVSIYNSLKAVAVENEPNLAKVNWGC